MYGVISYWVGEAGDTMMWLYNSHKEAETAMKKLYEQSYKLAIEDENFNKDGSYCETDMGCVAWDDGLCRYFEVVRQTVKEEIM